MREPQSGRARRGSLAGELVAGHELVRVLASGGMGEVYLARHRALGLERAFKVIRTDLREDREARERFTREAQVLARLQHNSIVHIIDFGELPSGWPYLAMEYIDGPNLEQLVELAPFPLHKALTVLEQVAAALQYAHKQNVIHRDLKPGNVLLRGGDIRQVKIIDFGLAFTLGTETLKRLTAEGHMIGSPLYMAPEQADGERDLTPAVDVYAFAGIAYTLLTGRAPFHGKALLQLVSAHAEELPPRLSTRLPTVPAFLDELLFACLAKDPSARPHSEELVGHFARLVRQIDPSASAPISLGAIQLALELPPPEDGEGVGHALANQILAVVGEIAANLSSVDRELARLLGEGDRIRDALTDVEMELAIVDASIAESLGAERAGAEAKRRVLEHRAGELQREQREVHRQLVARVESQRDTTSPVVKSLFGELDDAVGKLDELRRSTP